MEVSRTSLQLYRDCLRLVRHIAPGSGGKGLALRTQVRTSFASNSSLTKSDDVDTAKAAAVRALANYMLYESGVQEGSGIKKAMKKQVKDMDFGVKKLKK